MSDRPIQVGDLVMFVRSCCDGFRDGVSIFLVGHIRLGRPAPICTYCRKELPHGAYAGNENKYSGAPVQWLKRIPPLSELEGVRSEEKLKEPA